MKKRKRVSSKRKADPSAYNRVDSAKALKVPDEDVNPGDGLS